MAEYGSCLLFQEHDISITHLKRMLMRSEVSQPTPSTSGVIQGDTYHRILCSRNFLCHSSQQKLTRHHLVCADHDIQ